jgi:hypothetical protein
MFRIKVDGFTPIDVPNGMVWSSLRIWIAITLAFYVLRSIGLYVMAKMQNFNFKWMAFVPCVWIYVACRLVGESRFFNTTFKKLAVIATVIFGVGQLIQFVFNFILYFPVIGNLLAGGEVVFNMAEESTITYLEPIVSGFPFFVESNPYTQLGITKEFLYAILNVLDLSSSLFSLASTIILISIYVCLFKKYWPQHFILVPVLSWMGIFAPLVFAVRNKEPIDYNEYMKQRYNGWYVNGNPYANRHNPYSQQRSSNEPFDEFGDKKDKEPGNPFSEFDDK